MAKLKVASLFCGCGGTDVGLLGNFDFLGKHYDSNNMEIVYANDIDDNACKIFEENFGLKPDNRDIRQVSSSELPDFDILTGGFPCQSFSIIAQNPKRLGVKDDRGKLFFEMCRILKDKQPKCFIAENVKGLTNLEDVKEVIEHDFAEAGNGGYIVVRAKVLNASHYGVPQGRERVIFFGFNKKELTKKALEELSKTEISEEYNPYPKETHSKTDKSLSPIVTCKDAFTGLEEPDESDDKSQKIFSKAKYMGSHCQGQTEVKLDDIGPTIRSEHHGNIEYRRLSAEHGGKHIKELEKGLAERRLTVRECARIQTFPDNYQFILPKTENNVSVSSSDAYKIIGNAVPCVLAYNIAKNIESKWKLYFGE